MKNYTICLLAHQETPLLTSVSKSVNWAKSILILDNESGIDWKQYFPSAEKLNIVSIKGEITDFTAVRNTALQHCTTDWIFFVDSDEVVMPGAEMELLRVLHSGADGASVIRSDVFQGVTLRYGEAGTQNILRICRVEKTTFTGSVHERAVISGNVLQSDITLKHYSHETISEFITSVTQYSKIAAHESRFDTMSLLILLMQMSCFPVLKFLYNYVLRAGFKDGFAGLTYAYCMSLHSLLVRIYAYERRLTTAP